MEQVRAGDESAFGQLLERYWNPLEEYALSFLEDLDSSEDVVQEAFIDLWRGRRSWTPRGTLKAYLYRIVRHRSLQEKEKRAVRKRWQKIAEAPPSPLNPADHFEHDALSAALSRAVEALPPRRREIVVLARFHGLSYKQIGEIMGISVQTVANQMTAAMSTLRGLLSRDHH